MDVENASCCVRRDGRKLGGEGDQHCRELGTHIGRCYAPHLKWFGV